MLCITRIYVSACSFTAHISGIFWHVTQVIWRFLSSGGLWKFGIFHTRGVKNWPKLSIPGLFLCWKCKYKANIATFKAPQDPRFCLSFPYKGSKHSCFHTRTHENRQISPINANYRCFCQGFPYKDPLKCVIFFHTRVKGQIGLCCTPPPKN